MISNAKTDIYYLRRINCEKLYYICIENKDLSYKELMEKINIGTNKNYTQEELKKDIKYIKNNLSVSRATEIINIINDSIKKEKELKKGKISTQNFIDKKEIRKEMDRKNDKNHDESIELIKDALDTVIKEKRNSDKLFEEGTITYNNLLMYVKKNLKDLDLEKYIDFIAINYDIMPTTKEELNQMLEIINFFLVNLKNKIDVLRTYNTVDDRDKIKEFYVKGEDQLDEIYDKSILKLYNWKLRKLTILYDRYQTLYKIINDVNESNNIKNLKTIKWHDVLRIKEDEEFIYDYYRQLTNIKKQYDTHVKGLNSIGQKSKNEIEDIYMKKLLIGNNE